VADGYFKAKTCFCLFRINFISFLIPNLEVRLGSKVLFVDEIGFDNLLLEI
jgi:hypothetical protein